MVGGGGFGGVSGVFVAEIGGEATAVPVAEVAGGFMGAFVTVGEAGSGGTKSLVAVTNTGSGVAKAWVAVGEGVPGPLLSNGGTCSLTTSSYTSAPIASTVRPIKIETTIIAQ